MPPPSFLCTFKRQTSTPPPDSHDGLLLLLHFQLHPHSILIRDASLSSLKTKLTFHHGEAWVKRVMIEFLHFRELHLLSWGDVCKCRQSTERDSISVTLWNDGAASWGLASCLWTWRLEGTTDLLTPWPRAAPYPPPAPPAFEQKVQAPPRKDGVPVGLSSPALPAGTTRLLPSRSRGPL